MGGIKHTIQHDHLQACSSDQRLLPPPPVLRCGDVAAPRRERHGGVKVEVGHVVHSLVARPHTVEVVVGAVPPLPLDEVLLRVVDIFRLKVGALRGGGGGRAVVAVGPQGWLRVGPVLVGGRHRLGRVELFLVELVDWNYVVVEVAGALEVKVMIRKLARLNYQITIS